MRLSVRFSGPVLSGSLQEVKLPTQKKIKTGMMNRYFMELTVLAFRESKNFRQGRQEMGGKSREERESKVKCSILKVVNLVSWAGWFWVVFDGLHWD